MERIPKDIHVDGRVTSPAISDPIHPTVARVPTLDPRLKPEFRQLAQPVGSSLFQLLSFFNVFNYFTRFCQSVVSSPDVPRPTPQPGSRGQVWGKLGAALHRGRHISSESTFGNDSTTKKERIKNRRNDPSAVQPARIPKVLISVTCKPIH